MKCTLSLLIFLLISTVGIGQQAVLSFDAGKQECNDTISLLAWKEGKQYTVSSVGLERGEAQVLFPAGFLPGMVQLRFNGQCHLPDYMIIYSGEDIKLRMIPDDSLMTIRVDVTGQTLLFNRFNQRIDSLNQRLMKITELIARFSDDNSLISKVLKHRAEVISARKDLFDELHQKFGGMTFSHFLFQKEYFIPDIDQPTSSQQRDVLDHFFDHVDPLDSLLLRSDIFEDRIIDYINIADGVAGEGNEKEFINLVDRLMQRFKGSELYIRVSISFMQKWLLQKGYDLTREFLDREYLSAQCGSEEDMDLQKRLAAYARTESGKPAPEITWMSENAEHRLSELKASQTVLIFWATWCSHCEEVLPEIRGYLKGKKEVTVIAVALDPDEKAWSDKIKAYPGWIHLRAPGKWKDPLVELYGISGTPTMFLLDKDKRVLGKTADMKHLLLLIEENKH